MVYDEKSTDRLCGRAIFAHFRLLERRRVDIAVQEENDLVLDEAAPRFGIAVSFKYARASF